MDTLDGSENTAKISDSAYSNSCSNSQSRRSHSSMSTHSGSHSSVSSGFGEKLSTSGSSNKLKETSKKDKHGNKKKRAKKEAKIVEESGLLECRPPEPIPLFAIPIGKIRNVAEIPSTTMSLSGNSVIVDNDTVSPMDVCASKDEFQPLATTQVNTNVCLETSCQLANVETEGFLCAISMHDGVVMYATNNMTIILGYPKDMWIGRSFIDFVHPKDRKTLASQITNSLAIPNIVNDAQEKALQMPGIPDCAMVCRIRRYRALGVGFGIKDQSISFLPFLLKFSFKDINDEDGKIVYLIIQATPYYSAFKTPDECLPTATPFIIRHSAAGILEYIDINSVPYLGYLPQDLLNQDALLLYHPADLPYLKNVYESIVKDGNVAKSLPYRMLAQNGGYVKMETEWSSFVNPWSMKLEFVIGKHHVLEGPTPADVFAAPPTEPKPAVVKDEDKLIAETAKGHREDILKILTEVLTKPAEKAKQRMSKRCQDIALIMESMLAAQPKPDEELRVDIQEPDLNYERDSVMLGGISPHHDYNDGKSSIETPLSCNQLNYKENLQRYFDSHQNYNFDENTQPVLAIETNAFVQNIPKIPTEINSNCLMSPFAQPSRESVEMESSGSSTALVVNGATSPADASDSNSHRLTEVLLTKHNTEMEKELAKTHRECRSTTKVERSSDTRQKKKEHLARCNATFQPTLAEMIPPEIVQLQGIKRPSEPMDTEVPNKCPRLEGQATDEAATSRQPINPIVNTFMIDAAGSFPVYYPPPPEGTTSQVANPENAQQVQQQQDPSKQQQYNPMSWMYSTPVYGSSCNNTSPEMYSVQSQKILQSLSCDQALFPLGLPNSNYLQACKSVPLLKPSNKLFAYAAWREKIRAIYQGNLSVTMNRYRSASSNSASKSSNDQIFVTPPPKPEKPAPPKKAEPTSQSGQNSDEALDKTDGESSYSSFYSSFFKTESGSAEDSSDPKKARMELTQKNPTDASCYTYEAQGSKKPPRRKMEPPWTEQVNVTPELIYQYQIKQKPKNEVLEADKERMKNLEQPAMVEEQLGQLYLDMQLEGVAARLTLEEGITSSGSSGEDCFIVPRSKPPRRKREYSKLNMIYEENAPIPPSQTDILPTPTVEVKEGESSETAPPSPVS